MGFTLKFLAGEADALTEAFRGETYYKFDDPAVILAEADLSLHLEPRDLNLLSLEAGALAALPPTDLRSHLTVGVDDRDHGLLYVSAEWVAYFAAVPGGSAAMLSERWATRLREFYRQPQIVATESMVCSVSDLLALCERASVEHLPVVHVWWS